MKQPPAFFLFPVFFSALLTVAMIFGCSSRPTSPKTEELIEDPESELDPEPVFDCEKLAKTYVPCLPIEADKKLDVDYAPPPALVFFPCDSGTRLDVFTAFSGPQDVFLWKIVLESSLARQACLHIHLYSRDLNILTIDLIRRLKDSPEKGWSILESWYSEKKYLYADDPVRIGPPESFDPELLEELAVHVAQSVRFGITETLVLLNHRLVKPELIEQRILHPLPASRKTKPENRIRQEPQPDLHRHIREFSLLCRTRMDWKYRMGAISGCIDKTGTPKKAPDCMDLRQCISRELNEREWDELETVEPDTSIQPFAVIGKGSLRLHAVLEPRNDPSKRMLEFLLQIVDRRPEIQVLVYLDPEDGPSSIWTRILLATRQLHGEAAALCLLRKGYRYAFVLDPVEMAHLSFQCGNAPVDLQNVPKESSIPNHVVPAFSRHRMRPALLMNQRLVEGAVSLEFLEYGLLRLAGEDRNR